MGTALPGELAGLAVALGLPWPELDEDELYDAALRWAEVAAALRDPPDAPAAPAAAQLVPPVAGPAARRAALAADTLAGCLLTLATVGYELKRHTLARLGELTAFLAAGGDEAFATLTRAAVHRAARSATDLVDGTLVPLLDRVAAMA